MRFFYSKRVDCTIPKAPGVCPFAAANPDLHYSFLRISFFHFFSQKKNDICKPIYYIWVHSTE
ncbi:MAG: hypothetical protein H6Q26_3455 [Bacteroidetes bacterium]|nr:hypothetical protein [Bacteroidota bacterium]